MKRRDWIKVRGDWWESPSHRLISPGARYFGIYLLYLADSDPEWRETGVGRLLAPDMSPLGSQEVARMSGSSQRNVRRWIEELKRVGTLSVDESGAISFPSYRDHQEHRNAKHSRKARTAAHSGQESVHAVGAEEEVEVEEEAEADNNQKTSSSDQSPSEGDGAGRRTSRTVKDLIDPVWTWFEDECVSRGFARKCKGLSATERGEIAKLNTHIRSTLGLGLKREDTDRVIATLRACLAWKLDQAEVDRTSRKYIRGVSPWRRKSFDYWWSHVVDATEPLAPDGREPMTPAEAGAWCTEHGKYPKGWTFKRGQWVRK